MIRIILKTFFIILIITVFILPIFAHSYTLLEPLPNPSGGGVLEKDVGLRAYLNWLFSVALIATGFLAVLMIVIGGVEFMIGGANESMRKEGKNRISSALWGLLLALGAWLIVYTINPELVKLDFALPEAKIKLETPKEEIIRIRDNPQTEEEKIESDRIKCNDEVIKQSQNLEPSKRNQFIADGVKECEAKFPRPKFIK